MILIIDSFSIVVLIIATIAVFVGGSLGFFSWAKLRRKTYFLDYCNRKLGGKNE